MAGAMDAAPKRGAFISHILTESPVALVLQEYLQRAYPDDFPVFVASDNRSIPGGEGWWQHIRDSIKQRQVVLVLLSDESAAREWINFEAGVGDGSGAKVIPVAIKNYRFDKLDFPLKGFQGRYVGDLEGILYDIDQVTQRSASPLDKPAYLEAIKRAEESVTYRNLFFSPVRTAFNGSPSLMFEIENRGNTDIDLLFAEVHIPRQALDPNFPLSGFPPTLEVDTAGDLALFRYYSIHSDFRHNLRRLEPTITRSMGVRRLRDFRFPLKTEAEGLDLSCVIWYQIHGREIDTEAEEKMLRDIPLVPEKCS
jgi:hypothetical protein